MAAAMPAALSRYLPQIEDALRDALAEGPDELVHAARYVMGWEAADRTPIIAASGKRIRPSLVMFGASLFTDDPGVALPGAVAVELVHNFSLVHDEIQDRDATRHGRPTLYALHGDAQAINAGDFIYAMAVNSLLSGPVDADRKVRALSLLQDAIVRMIDGQWHDLTFESRSDVSTDEYVSMIAGKTGAMLAVPLAIGATLAGATAKQADALRTWGERVGLAFQIWDDHLGIWGEPNLTGKSNSNDILRKKKTLPIIHGLAGSARPTIERVYQRPEPTPADIESVVSALNEAGSSSFTRETADHYVAEASRLLDLLDLPPERRSELRAVGEYLVNRDN
jgi:geranylgeranyl diphosphate synthase type I